MQRWRSHDHASNIGQNTKTIVILEKREMPKRQEETEANAAAIKSSHIEDIFSILL